MYNAIFAIIFIIISTCIKKIKIACDCYEAIFFFKFKNKCVRYWPDENEAKLCNKITVCNLGESSTADYTLREFLVTKEGHVSTELISIYSFHNVYFTVYW